MTITKIKKDAWNWCSKYIRLKYADRNGFVGCYTCGVVKHWKEMQAGHGLSGRGNTILFEEKIICPQCSTCNVFKGGNYDVFHVKLEKENGLGFLEKMLKQKHQMKQFTLKEILVIRDKYKKLTEELIKEKDFLDF